MQSVFFCHLSDDSRNLLQKQHWSGACSATDRAKLDSFMTDVGDLATAAVANLPQRYDAICKQSDNE